MPTGLGEDEHSGHQRRESFRLVGTQCSRPPGPMGSGVNGRTRGPWGLGLMKGTDLQGKLIFQPWPIVAME